MKRRTLLTLVGVGVVAEGLAVACGGATTAPSASPTAAAKTAAATTAATAPTAAAKPTGRISVYSALNESTNNEFIKAFKTAYPGIEVDLLPLAAAGELQTRITAEKASPKADIFVGGDRSFHDGLGKAALLEPYTSPNASAISDAAKDPKGTWTGWYFGVFGFVINSDRLNKEIGGKTPKTWDDLLDPAWKGKMVMPDPVKTGGGYIFLATQVFRFGRDETKALDYMKKLHPQISQYVGSAPQGIQLVSQGQFVGGPNWSHDILTERAKNPNVALAVPENTGYEVGAVSIVKGRPAANLPASKAFVDWILTKEAGELNVKLSNRVSVRKDVAPAPGAPTLEQVKLVNYDPDFAAANKDRLIKAWQAAVGL
jgi:iron(III) transport system substrate-binding protein